MYELLLSKHEVKSIGVGDFDSNFLKIDRGQHLGPPFRPPLIGLMWASLLKDNRYLPHATGHHEWIPAVVWFPLVVICIHRIFNLYPKLP